jgi:hypothetical protein
MAGLQQKPSSQIATLRFGHRLDRRNDLRRRICASLAGTATYLPSDTIKFSPPTLAVRKIGLGVLIPAR